MALQLLQRDLDIGGTKHCLKLGPMLAHKFELFFQGKTLNTLQFSDSRKKGRDMLDEPSVLRPRSRDTQPNEASVVL
jgi:hypothetical protein